MTTTMMVDTVPTEFTLYHDDPNSPARRFINQYEILKPLGRGLYTVVHLVKDVTTNRLYAAKVYPTAMLENKRACIFKKDGIQQITELDKVYNDINIHYHLPKNIFGALHQVLHDQQHSQLITILEYFPGGQLLKWNPNQLRYQLPIPHKSFTFPPLNPQHQPDHQHVLLYNEKALKPIIRSLLIALSSLHTAGVVHKDVKPDNILLSHPPSIEHIEIVQIPILPEVQARKKKLIQQETLKQQLLHENTQPIHLMFHQFDQQTSSLDNSLSQYSLISPDLENSPSNSSSYSLPSLEPTFPEINDTVEDDDLPDPERFDCEIRTRLYMEEMNQGDDEAEEMGTWIWADADVIKSQSKFERHIKALAEKYKSPSIITDSYSSSWCRSVLCDFNTAQLTECVKTLPIYDAEGTQMFTAPECFAPRTTEEYETNTRRPISGEKRDIWSVGVVVFVALFGIPPFRGETAIELQCNVLEAALEVPSYREISTEARDFIEQILANKVPEDRLTVKEALEHAWFN